MSETRRQFVSGILSLGSLSIAGCVGAQDSEASTNCQTEGPNTETEVFQQATVRPIGDDAILEIVFLGEDAFESGVDSISIYEGETLRHRIPVATRKRYKLRVGTPPTHGVYRIVAENQARSEIEQIEIRFNCHTGA